jgi:sulfofructose kinase
MAADFDVVCVGAANFDTIVAVERVPADDERITSESIVAAGGGPAATAAVALARQGARVAMCAVVGDDVEGETVRHLLELEGVDTHWMRVDPTVRTARAIVLASRSTGGRSIITTVAPRPVPDDVPVDAARWLHVDQTGYAAARAALGAGSRTRLSIDAGNPIAALSLERVDLFAPTLAALLARYSTTDVAAAFTAAHAEGAEMIVATNGGDGSYVLAEDGLRLVPPYPVDVVSTLGAGDVFHGTLLASLVAGTDIMRATAEANAAAAMACTGLDGRSAIPTRAELASFIHERSKLGN